MPDFTRARSRAVFLLLFVATLAAAACSSTPTVEASGSSVETSEAAESVDGEPASEDSASIEAEEAAMGEDDPEGNDPDAAGQDGGDQGGTDGNGTDADDNGDSQADSGIAAGDLSAALIAGQDIQFSLPFLYLTVDQSCDGCAATASLYYVPGEVEASILTLEAAFVDGSEVPLTEVDPILREGDPRLVAQLLADADEEGSLDAYSIDPVSGLVTSWSVGGDEVTLRCLQVDTRPIELRSELCRDSLIG